MVLAASDVRTRMQAGDLTHQPDGFYALDFYAMGTSCRILFTARSRRVAEDLRRGWLDWLADYEFRYSRFIPESLVCRINREAGGGWVETDKELESLFALCDWYHWLTGGIFDPTALPLLLLWDYKAARPAVPEPAGVAEAVRRVSWKRVERRPGVVRLPEAGMALDLGGIGKEYAVDRIVEMAAAAGVEAIMASFGADVRVHGAPPEGGSWRVGLQSPVDPDRCWTGVMAHERAVASSGDYLRYFEQDGRRYGHIIDARTGYPVDNGCRAVSVVAPTCTEAGVLSTAAFVLGPEAGLKLIDRSHQAEGCIWTEGGAHCSRRFQHYVIQTH